MNSNKKSIKDQIIFVFYLNVNGLTRQQADSQLYEMIQNYSLIKDYTDVVQFFLPIKEGDSRIEMLNPGSINDNTYPELLEKLDDINENYKIYLDSHI